MYTFCLPACCRERFCEALEELRAYRHDSGLPPPAVLEGLELLGDKLIIRLIPEFKPSEVVAKITDYGVIVKYSDGGIPRYCNYISMESIRSYTGEYTKSGIVVCREGLLYKLPFKLFNDLQMKNFYNQILQMFNTSSVSKHLAESIGFKCFDAASKPEPPTCFDLRIAFDYCYESIFDGRFCSIRQSKTTGEAPTAQLFLQRPSDAMMYVDQFNNFCIDVVRGFPNPNGFEMRALKIARSCIEQNGVRESDIPMFFALINAWYERNHRLCMR